MNYTSTINVYVNLIFPLVIIILHYRPIYQPNAYVVLQNIIIATIYCRHAYKSNSCFLCFDIVNYFCYMSSLLWTEFRLMYLMNWFLAVRIHCENMGNRSLSTHVLSKSCSDFKPTSMLLVLLMVLPLESCAPLICIYIYIYISVRSGVQKRRSP